MTQGNMQRKKKNLRLTKLVVLAALAALGQPALAGDDRPALRIVVEGLSRSAHKCEVTGSGLEQRSAEILDRNGVRPAPAGEYVEPYLYVNVNVVAAPNGCLMGHIVSVQSNDFKTDGIGRFRRRAAPGVQQVLCTSGGLATAPHGMSGTYLIELVEADIRDCLGRLEY